MTTGFTQIKETYHMRGSQFSFHQCKLKIMTAQIDDYSNLNPIQYITRSFGNSFMLRAINDQEVKDLVQNLKSNKASIGIPNKCTKRAVDLTKVSNYSLVQGIMPDVLKVSRVTPIDKSGDAADPSNYHPISTLY